MKVQYDGRNLVPEKPLNVPVGSTFEVELTQAPSEPSATKRFVKYPLAELAELFAQAPELDLPTDGAINHDHYLYGAPKHE